MPANIIPSFILSWALLALTVILQVALADGCSVPPLSLTIKNNTLTDGIAANRGVWINLGGEPVSLRVTTTFNNTRVRNSGDCEHQGRNGSSLGPQCQGASGSSVDTSQFTSWLSVESGDWNVSSVDPPGPDETILYGYVNASLSNSISVPMLPTKVWSNLKADNKSGLALGRHSSFTQRLLDLGLVPSRAFGIFFGSRSQTRPMDGNIIIGGYDAARVGGPWTNFTTGSQYMPTTCPLQVRISDIVLSNSQGRHSLMGDNQSTVAACVDPHQNQFTLTPSMFARWANLTDNPNPDSVNVTAQVYPPEHEHLMGELTITLSDGHTTVIPHHELVTQERGSDEQGKYAVVNSSNIMASVGPAKPGSFPLLGGVYLSQNYLFVDYERDTFSMAPAVNVALDDGQRRIQTVCPPKMSREAEDKPRGELSGGSIAGIVIGSTAAAGLVGFLLFTIYRSRKLNQQRLSEEAAGHSQPAGHRSSDTSDLSISTPQLDSKAFIEKPA